MLRMDKELFLKPHALISLRLPGKVPTSHSISADPPIFPAATEILSSAHLAGNTVMFACLSVFVCVFMCCRATCIAAAREL
jgi:hypothetical protein